MEGNYIQKFISLSTVHLSVGALTHKVLSSGLQIYSVSANWFFANILTPTRDGKVTYILSLSLPNNKRLSGVLAGRNKYLNIVGLLNSTILTYRAWLSRIRKLFLISHNSQIIILRCILSALQLHS